MKFKMGFGKKIWSLLLCLSMVLSCISVPVYAATEDGICEHHTEHTVECGYVAGTSGSPCTHKHTEECYQIVQCVHNHSEETCGKDFLACTHVCSVESGCIRMKHNCHHTHDDSCGYSEPRSASACTHVHDENCGYREAVEEILCDCTDMDENGNRIHMEGCGYVAPISASECTHIHDASCGYAEASEGTPCHHVCTIKVDNAESCYDLLCSHAEPNQHDDICGYTEPVSEASCKYQCAECINGTEDEAVTKVRDQINALPNVSELKAMSQEEQNEIYENAQDAWDAYEQLTEEQKSQLTAEKEKLDNVHEFFASRVMTAKEVPEILKEYASTVYLANDYVLYIEAAQTSGKTVVYYYDNDDPSTGNKVYMNPSGTAGDDLSNQKFAGAEGSDQYRGNHNTIIMKGGKIGRIYAVYTGSHKEGSVKIIITGGTVVQGIQTVQNQYCQTDKCSTYVYSEVDVSIAETERPFMGTLVKKGSEWKVSRNPIVPSNITMTLNSSDSMDIPANSTVTVQGTVYNYGAKITGDGKATIASGGQVICNPHSYGGNCTPNSAGDGTHLSGCYFHADALSTTGEPCTFDENGICTICGGYQPAVWNSSKNYYEISNYGQLLWYGTYCRTIKGTYQNAVLTKDIKIGSSDSPYVDWPGVSCGDNAVIDGQNHTIEMYFTYSNVDGTADALGKGIFFNNYASFKNMILKGSITCNTTGRVGAVACDGFQVKCSNIISYVDITNQSSGPTGGLIGEFGVNASNGSVINNCAVYADISGTGDVGGFVGKGWNGNQYWKITNSAFYGNVSGNRVGAIMGYSQTDGGAPYCSITNCYYPENMVSLGGADRTIGSDTGTTKTAAQFASGDVTWLLNNKNNSGTGTWKQTIGTDALPTFTGNDVYAVEGKVNLYTNDSDYIKKNSDGYFMIYTKSQLIMFQQFVDLDNKTVNAILMNDIDMSGVMWKSICSTDLYYSNSYSGGNYPDKGFQGIFDGNYHLIQNLTVQGTSGNKETYGLFGTIAGTVKNLGIEGFTFDTNGAADIRTGAVVGQILGGTVSNCYVTEASITPGTYVAGGLAGCNYAGTIENCHVCNSTISATKNRTGWIVGDNRADTAGDRVGTIRNCYTDGTSLSGSYSGTESSSAIKSASQFQSGEVAYLLNNSINAGIWKQTLGTDDYPNYVGKSVYYTGSEYVNLNTPSQSDGYYLLYTVQDVLAFASIVNGGQTTANAKMMNDIDMSSVPSWGIGTETQSFAGTFNGDGHTLTINMKGSTYVAPFPYTASANIHDMYVDGTITASGKFAAGIVGGVQSNSKVTLKKCISRVTINSSVSGDGTHGGLIGVANGSADISYCGFSGKILGSSTNACGGLVGWANSDMTISNSYVAGTFGVSTDACNTFARNPGKITLTNCYYLNSLNTSSGYKSGTPVQKSLEQFKSGEVTWCLNGQKSDDLWNQTIGTQEYPVFNGKTVYYGMPYCDVEMSPKYTNTAKEATVAAHTPDYVNGFCTVCDAYQSCAGKGTSAEPYQISNAGQLYWFAKVVNSGINNVSRNLSAYGELTADITDNGYNGGKKVIANGALNGSGSDFRVWTPIGRGNYQFKGSFKGNGYTISGLYYNDSSQGDLGLFGSSWGDISGVSICDTYFCGGASVGAVAGYIKGKTISNCSLSNSYIKGSSNVGGIVGYVAENTTIEKCWNSGSTVTGTRVGGIVGMTISSAVIRHCYHVGTLDGSSIGGILSSNGSNSTVLSCFHYGTYGIANSNYGDIIRCYSLGSEENGSIQTEENFREGQVAWLLNDGKTDGTQVWYQNLGTDDYPGFSGGTVYCGYENCKQTSKVYRNQSLYDERPHQYTGAPTFHWSSDLSSCTAYFYCEAETLHDLKNVACSLSSSTSEDGKVTTITASVPGTEYTDSREITNKIVRASISWTSMDFKYDNGQWNPQTHGPAEGNGQWVPTKEGGGVVTVTNTGTEKMDVTFAYSSTVENVNANTFVSKMLTLGAEKSGSTSFLPEGRPEENLSKAKLGTITVQFGESILDLTDVDVSDYAEAIKNYMTDGDSVLTLRLGNPTLSQAMGEAITKGINDAGITGCKLTLLDTVTIEARAFISCTTLEEIYLPEAVTLGNYVFSNCSSLKKADCPKVETLGNEIFRYSGLEEIYLPKVKNIPFAAFGGCKSLKYADLPEATQIAMNAFSPCRVLENIYMPKVEQIGQSAFNGCSVLKSVNAPLATTLGDNAFRDNSALTYVRLPMAASIGKFAFSADKALKQIHLTKITTLSTNIFDGCTTLNSAIFENVTVLETNALWGCNGLRTLTFASEITSVGDKWYNSDGSRNISLMLNKAQADNISCPATFGKNGQFGGYTFKEIKEYTE